MIRFIWPLPDMIPLLITMPFLQLGSLAIITGLISFSLVYKTGGYRISPLKDSLDQTQLY